MSKLLVNLALLQTKALVNAYTWTTLPFYTAFQRPWRRLKLSKSTAVQATTDKHGRVIYSRAFPQPENHPYFKCTTFPEILPQLDPNRPVIGVRDVVREELAFDSEGKSVKVDGKALKKVQLAEEYRWSTVKQVMERVDNIAKGLKQLGVKKGDKVAVYAENGVAWMYVCLALMKLNAVTVTLYSTLGDSGVIWGINQSEPNYVITSQSLLPKLNSLSDQIEHLNTIIYIPDGNTKYLDNDSEILKFQTKGFQIHNYEQLESDGTKLPDCEFPAPKPEDTAVIMYTSGTTGNPKGVVINHSQLYAAFLNLFRIDLENDGLGMNAAAFAAYLPMAHIFGYLLNMTMFVSNSKLAFCSPLTLLDSSPAHVQGQIGDIKLIRPEFLIVVPLVLERILKEIYRKLNERSALAAPLFNYLMEYKIRWTSRGYDTPIINRVFCKKIADQFGGRLKYVLVSSATLHPRTQAMVKAALNVNIVQAYGSTEVTGGANVLPMTDLSYGTCGVPYHSIKFFIKDWTEGGYSSKDIPNPRGEIVIGGESLSEGYYKLPEETKDAFFTDEDDGTRWFKSGDIGEVLPNGSIKIIDRKKDLTKLANGEFVSLGKIESGLRNSRYVENICICTDPYRNHVTALISPNRRALADLVKTLSKSHLTFEGQCSDPEVTAHVLDSLRQLGKELGLASKEIPVAIRLVSEEWSPDNNLLTAAFKMKRKQVYDFYRVQIDQMFNNAQVK